MSYIIAPAQNTGGQKSIAMGMDALYSTATRMNALI